MVSVPWNRPYDQQRKNPVRAGVAARPESWDWSFEVDGALALAPQSVPEATPGVQRLLKQATGSVTVPRMALPQAAHLSGRSARLREREEMRARVRRARRLAVLAVLGAVALAVALLTAFSSGGRELVGATGPAPANRLLPAGPPEPEVVALHGSLRILLPVNHSHITAIAYHAAGAGALPLEPTGTQANAGFFDRIAGKLFGGGGSELRYNLLEGGTGHKLGGLDVGAPVGTDVYAPVDGTVIAIADHIVNGRRYGVTIDIQPSGSPGLVVTVSNIRPDQALTVGSTVSAPRTKIGRVIDLSAVEQAVLARYTQDNGEHVHLHVHAAATLSAP
jgi:murein DD-endopeptidase MepM/ murein hydrolase activator NlpD